MASFSQNQPFTVTEEQEKLKRRRKLAEAQALHGMQDTSATVNAGGGNVVANWGGAISRAVDNYISKRDLDAMDKQSDQLAMKANAEMHAEGDEYQRMRRGEAADMMAPGVSAPDVQAGQIDPGAQIMTKPDKMRATAKAMMSQFGPLQEIAKMDRAEDVKGMITPEKALAQVQHANPKSLQAAVESQNVGDVEWKPQIVQHDGVAQSVMPGAGKTILNHYSDVTPATATSPPTYKNLDTNQPHGVVGGAQNPFAARASQNATESFKMMGEGKVKAEKAFEGLNTVVNVKKLITDTPAEFFGPLSTPQQIYNKIAQQLNMPISQGPIATEKINAELGNLMLEKVRQVAPVSDPDKETVNNIVGSARNSKEALEQLMAWQEDKFNKIIMNHHAMVDQIGAGDSAMGSLAHYKLAPTATTSQLSAAYGGYGSREAEDAAAARGEIPKPPTLEELPAFGTAPRGSPVQQPGTGNRAPTTGQIINKDLVFDPKTGKTKPRDQK